MKSIFTLSLLITCGLCFGQRNPNIRSFETHCDSIYKNKNYKIILIYFSEGIDTISNSNVVFQLFKTTSAKDEVIFEDTIYSQTGTIVFRDFNNDGIKDILIQNISDVRSNWTYNLYLVDINHDKLQKIRGFEEIKNPNYLPKHNLIDTYVNSGTNWTSFYKIQGDSIKDFDIVIYDDQTENGSYDREYKNAIHSILKNENTKQ